MTSENKRVVLEKVREPPEEEIKAAVQHLREWIIKEPHLPNIDNYKWLEAFFYNSKFSLEKTKLKLDNYYSLRNKYPQILKNRDPTDPRLVKYCSDFNLSNKLTVDGARFFLIRFDLDVNGFIGDDSFKFVTMVADLLLLEPDREASFVFLIDMQNYTYKHFLKIAASLKAGADILVNAYTERTEALHLFNAPSFTEFVVKSMLPFFPQKYANRIFVNSNNCDSFLQMFDEKDLPSDLGGKGPSWADCADWTRLKLEEHKKWFRVQDDICSNERLRQKDEKRQLEDMKGSFRKLEVD